MAVCPVSENGNRKLPLISHELANGAENDRMQPVACSRSSLFYALSSVWYIPRFRFEDSGSPRVTISISPHAHICFISNVDTIDELTDIHSSRFYQGDSTVFRYFEDIVSEDGRRKLGCHVTGSAETVAYATQPATSRISPSVLSLSVTIDHRERAPMTSHPFISHRELSRPSTNDDPCSVSRSVPSISIMFIRVQ